MLACLKAVKPCFTLVNRTTPRHILTVTKERLSVSGLNLWLELMQ
jgi:hypothetical protein